MKEISLIATVCLIERALLNSRHERESIFIGLMMIRRV